MSRQTRRLIRQTNHSNIVIKKEQADVRTESQFKPADIRKKICRHMSEYTNMLNRQMSEPIS